MTIALRRLKEFTPYPDHPAVFKKALIKLRNDFVDELSDDEFEPSDNEVITASSKVRAMDRYWKEEAEEAIENNKPLRFPKSFQTHNTLDYKLDDRKWSPEELKQQYGVK